MNYLESYNLYNKSEQDIRDICLELEDIGMSSSVNHNDSCISTIEIKFISSKYGVPWCDIEDCLLRLKGYLGSSFIRLIIKRKNDRFTSTLELNKDTKLYGLIWYVAIKYNKNKFKNK